MDVIKRSDAIKTVEKANGNMTWADRDALLKTIRGLPSAQTEGEWVRKKDDRFVCSECGCICGRYGKGTSPLHGNRWNYNFCPNCGARMKVAAND